MSEFSLKPTSIRSASSSAHCRQAMRFQATSFNDRSVAEPHNLIASFPPGAGAVAGHQVVPGVVRDGRSHMPEILTFCTV